MSERVFISETPTATTFLQRDASDAKDQHRVMMVHKGRNRVLEENARLRNSHLMKKGMKKGIMDNQKIEYWFRIPSLELYQEFQRLHPRVMEEINSPDESVRMKGARAMSLLEPEWVIFNR